MDFLNYSNRKISNSTIIEINAIRGLKVECGYLGNMEQSKNIF
jgi:hypothetical protein